jgi:hypothetical protein
MMKTLRAGPDFGVLGREPREADTFRRHLDVLGDASQANTAVDRSSGNTPAKSQAMRDPYVPLVQTTPATNTMKAPTKQPIEHPR